MSFNYNCCRSIHIRLSVRCAYILQIFHPMRSILFQSPVALLSQTILSILSNFGSSIDFWNRFYYLLFIGSCVKFQSLRIFRLPMTHCTLFVLLSYRVPHCPKKFHLAWPIPHTNNYSVIEPFYNSFFV